jgi:predicted ATP-grasp superfamily ATP-dependent carboligase
VVSLGGMYDDVLHTESIVSGVYSDVAWREVFANNDVSLIDYEGPSGIHSLIMQKVQQMQHPFVGLWGHSPLYLRGTNFRVVMRMLHLLGAFFGFSVDTDELKNAQGEFEQQIGTILESNEELREHIEQIKQIRNGEPKRKDGPKVVHIKDFMRPRDPE